MRTMPASGTVPRIEGFSPAPTETLVDRRSVSTATVATGTAGSAHAVEKSRSATACSVEPPVTVTRRT